MIRRQMNNISVFTSFFKFNRKVEENKLKIKLKIAKNKVRDEKEGDE